MSLYLYNIHLVAFNMTVKMSPKIHKGMIILMALYKKTPTFFVLVIYQVSLLRKNIHKLDLSQT